MDATPSGNGSTRRPAPARLASAVRAAARPGADNRASSTIRPTSPAPIRANQTPRPRPSPLAQNASGAKEEITFKRRGTRSFLVLSPEDVVGFNKAPFEDSAECGISIVSRVGSPDPGGTAEYGSLEAKTNWVGLAAGGRRRLRKGCARGIAAGRPAVAGSDRRAAQSVEVGSDELTAFATREDALLSLLEATEQSALGRNAVRFRTDVPVTVAVASLRGETPFWVEDQGFRLAGFTLQTEDGEWVVHHKSYPRGWVGLGVNGLDRRPTTHYAAFVRAASGQPSLDVDELELVQDEGAGWRAD